MAKLKHLLSAILFLTQFCVSAQSYHIQYIGADEDSTVLQQKGGLQTFFSTKEEANLYLVRLPSLLQSRGFITASLDSILMDSAGARVHIYLGEQYKWAKINSMPQQAALLDSIQWNEKNFSGAVDFKTIQLWQKKILDYLEETGYPFGKVFLENININGEEISADLKIIRGPLYKIDSIRVYGDAKVNTLFLQRYLDIQKGSPYNKKKLAAISKKISELGYVQEEHPFDISLSGAGSVLNLYLKPKKSSQVNALIGFLPNSDQLTDQKKILITADVNILLKNAFGNGETIGLLWQQLQQKSPRLNLLFDQPYVFRSPFGVSFGLDMYRKDSSFLNLNMNLGTSYKISDKQTGSLFLQRRQTILNNVNTNQILQTRALPYDIDETSQNLGVTYAYNGTNYRFNPRKGDECTISATTGIKKIKKNAQILGLEDPSDPSFKFGQLYDTVKLKAYQFRITTSAAHYIPVGKQGTLKTAINAGIYQSANYFRNELFQIGGYKLLRGFDEESQYVSKYVIGTVEYRYLIGLNSAFFVFFDGGYGKHLLEQNPDHTYIGTGIGLSFETKAGIINVAWALGKRDDLDLNLRQSKVHLGFASFF